MSSRRSVGVDDDAHEDLWDLKNEYQKKKGREPSLNDLIKAGMREIREKKDPVSHLEKRLRQLEKERKREEREEFMLF